MHEKNHMDNWNLWWPGGYNKDNDSDEDYVPDDVERDDPGLDENKQCSCDEKICEYILSLSIPKPEEYAIDFECLAFKAELNWKVCSADEEDFSDLSRRIYNKSYGCK